MKFRSAVIFSLIALFSSPVRAEPRYTVKDVLLLTGAVAGGAMGEQQLDCWSNMGHIATHAYSAISSGFMGAEVVSIVFAANAGCALALVVAGTATTEVACRIGRYVFTARGE